MRVYEYGELAIMVDVLSKLGGGDRRSIGKVDDVVSAVRKKPDLFKDLVTRLFEEDPVVRMRAADAIEKLIQTGSPAIQSRGKKILPKLKNLSQRRKAG
jgi:hypothetical protein